LEFSGQSPPLGKGAKAAFGGKQSDKLKFVLFFAEKWRTVRAPFRFTPWG
jgi:hypothetical protein